MNKNKSSGFINFCFPISFTILVFILGWPYVIMYELGYQVSDNIFSTGPIVAGIVVNAVILFVVGIIVDRWRKTKGFLQKKYYLKLPLLFLIISGLLFILLLVDKSCFPA